MTLASYITACSNENGSEVEHDHPHSNNASANENHGHEHDEEDHEDDEASLGLHDIAGIKVEAAQGHGSVEAGKEGHLVIKLPQKDNGATTVRAWIGTDDRTLSSVGKGEYDPSHDEYMWLTILLLLMFFFYHHNLNIRRHIFLAYPLQQKNLEQINILLHK